jgi:hypothetical protein
MSDLDAIVNRLIHEYKKSHAISDTPSVFRSTYKASERVGAYNLETVHETAEQLLLQLKKDKAEKASEQDRIKLEEPPLLVLAKRVRTFTTYFCGLKKDKPIWCYQEFLAARLNFAEAEQMAATLGADVFALPANERRAVARLKR